MTEKVREAILTVIERKRRDGDVLPYATSVEVAHLLRMEVDEVERIAEQAEGITKGRTSDYSWYHE